MRVHTFILSPSIQTVTFPKWHAKQCLVPEACVNCLSAKNSSSMIHGNLLSWHWSNSEVYEAIIIVVGNRIIQRLHRIIPGHLLSNNLKFSEITTMRKYVEFCKQTKRYSLFLHSLKIRVHKMSRCVLRNGDVSTMSKC